MKKILIYLAFLLPAFTCLNAQSPGDVQVVEVMKDPSMSGAADSLGEWFEVYNKSNVAINMNGWIIADKDFDRDTINNGGPLMIPPGGYLALGSNNNTAQNGGYTCNYRYRYSRFKLGNTDDEIILRLPNGTLIDSLGWSATSGWVDPSGASFVFTGCPWQDNQDSTLWVVATSRENNFVVPGADFGSPGTRGILQSAGATQLSHTVTNVSCHGAGNGAIDLHIAGCAAPFVITWITTGATTEDISGLNPGTYIVRVQDSLGLVLYDTATVIEPAVLGLSGSTTPASCPTFLNGTVNITPTGGTTPYRYSWSNGATSQNLNNVAPGTYIVTLRDTHNCTLLDTFTVGSVANTLASTVTTVSAGCPLFNNGSIDLSVSGGTGAYTYHWSNNVTTQDQSNIGPGTYIVTITDGGGCTLNDTAVVSVVAGSITATFAVTHATCPNWNNGAIDLTTGGGTGSLTYAWSNSAITQDISSLRRGWYRVTVSDGSGCTRTDSAFVDSIPQTLTFTAVASNPSCAGVQNGAINVTPSGGAGTYHYAWSNTATTQDLTGLGGGSYSLTLSDSLGCSYTQGFTLTPGNGPQLSLSAANISCHAAQNGSITSSVNGGTSPYTYLWSNSSVNANLSGLAAGSYSVVVTDSNGCTATDTAAITEPAALSLSMSSTPVSGAGGNGTASVSASGGRAPYTYLWTPGGGTSSSLTNLHAGTYSVRVTDSSGCMAIDTVVVDSNANSIAGSLQNHLQVFPNPAKDQIGLAIEAGFEGMYQVELISLSGQVLRREEYPNAVMQTMIRVDDLAEGLYLLRVKTAGQLACMRMEVRR